MKKLLKKIILNIQYFLGIKKNKNFNIFIKKYSTIQGKEYKEWKKKEKERLLKKIEEMEIIRYKQKLNLAIVLFFMTIIAFFFFITEIFF